MMSFGRTRRRWFWLLKNTLNRATLRLGKSGRGPISVIRHTGRKSGRIYETPLLLATHDGDFVAELTYGPSVDWYRNVEAAGGCTVLTGGVEYRIDAVRPCDPAVGMRAFGMPAALILRLLRRNDFRILHVAGRDRPR